MFCSEPKLSKTLFGENMGCFEPPHKYNKPNSNHDCPEIMPLSYNPKKVDLNSLNETNIRVHPVAGHIDRKILGTRLSESHKTRNECLFHNPDLCKQGCYIKEPSNLFLSNRIIIRLRSISIGIYFALHYVHCI